MAYSDNPAFDDLEDKAGVGHRAMWDPVYASGSINSSNTVMRAMATDLARGRPEAEVLSAVAAVADADADGNPDLVSTAVTAGAPGSFDEGLPYNLAALIDIAPTPSPGTAWTTGQSVFLGDGSEAYWDSADWQAGQA
jgi:hypothetical protein